MQVAEITRAETSERARLLTVHSYAVTLDLARVPIERRDQVVRALRSRALSAAAS